MRADDEDALPDGLQRVAAAARRVVAPEDADLVDALARATAVAIENGRLVDQARRRQAWLAASTRTTRQLLSEEGEDPLRLIARQTRELARAELVSVVLPTADGQRLMVEVAAGTNADELTGFSYPVADTYAGATFQTGRPVRLDVSAGGTHYVHLTEVLDVGPVMVVPLVGGQRMRGALVVGRARGRISFDESELQMATTFANQAAVALELADARADRERVLLLEDRERIARDLHDHVIQQLFAAGLTAQSVAAGLDDPSRAERLNRIVTGIDDTIRRIRTTIFELRGPLGPQAGTVRVRVLGIAEELAGPLGFAPQVDFDGPVDSAVPEAVVDDVVAVVREGLSNVARHARAGRARVSLKAGDGRLTLEISDDGVGLGAARRRSGLANLHRRADRYGGALQVGAAGPPTDPPGREGTRLTWTIPLA